MYSIAEIDRQAKNGLSSFVAQERNFLKKTKEIILKGNPEIFLNDYLGDGYSASSHFLIYVYHLSKNKQLCSKKNSTSAKSPSR